MQARKRDSLSENFQSEVQIRLGRRDDPLLLVYARQFLERIGYYSHPHLPTPFLTLSLSVRRLACRL